MKNLLLFVSILSFSCSTVKPSEKQNPKKDSARQVTASSESLDYKNSNNQNPKMIVARVAKRDMGSDDLAVADFVAVDRKLQTEKQYAEAFRDQKNSIKSGKVSLRPKANGGMGLCGGGCGGGYDYPVLGFVGGVLQGVGSLVANILGAVSHIVFSVEDFLYGSRAIFANGGHEFGYECGGAVDGKGVVYFPYEPVEGPGGYEPVPGGPEGYPGNGMPSQDPGGLVVPNNPGANPDVDNGGLVIPNDPNGPTGYAPVDVEG